MATAKYLCQEDICGGSTQRLCGFAIDQGAVCLVMSRFVDKLTFFYLSIMIVDGSVQ